MPVCVACSTDLDPQWKYCISCGLPVADPAVLNRSARPVIPGAIRPDNPAPTASRSSIPRAALIVIALAIVGSVGAVIVAIQVLR